MNDLRKIQEFARYEFKYIITNATSYEIEREVKNFMQYDGYASKKENNFTMLDRNIMIMIYQRTFMKKLMA